MNLLAIDPGKATGWAYFRNHILVMSGVIPFDISMTVPFATWSVDEVIIEKPVIYDPKRWEGDPNDLISVAIVAGYIGGIVNCRNVKWITPQRWKGNRPKNVDHRHTMSLLSTEEKEVIKEDWKGVLKSQKHNMIDAIGIGLWYLRRK
jgi:hypothetical protein